MTERALLQYVTPAGVLADAQGDILYLHGHTGAFLEPAPGEAGVNNLLKMAREGLRRELAVALRKAATEKQAVIHRDLRVRTNGHYTQVDLAIHPVTTGQTPNLDPSLFLVVFTESPKGVAPPAPTPDAPANDQRVEALLRELRGKEDYLQSMNEELETSNEELKSSNEEMQSVNEELQSTNEELETSKEELQSVNEELATVNNELQTKVADLSRANNDMNNLLAGTGIATIFVDHQLRLMRFTPAATSIIHLILGDIGRPVGHILSNLVDYSTLEGDTRSVLASLVPKELEVRTKEGQWFTLRIQPYRTLDNVIEGAVITFVDITEMRKAKDDLEKANALLRRRKKA
jgi:two-component system CheB/CheR fusion protein